MYLNTLNSNILTDTVLPFRTFTISNHKNQTKNHLNRAFFGPNFYQKTDFFWFSWISASTQAKISDFGQKFWLFLKKPEQGQKKPEKGQNFAKRPEFYTISHKRSPKQARILQKRAEIYTISQIPIAVRDGTSRKFDFVWKKLANFQKNDLKCNKNANFAVWGSKFNNRFSAPKKFLGPTVAEIWTVLCLF